MPKMNEIIDMLTKMKGALYVFEVNPESKEDIIDIERNMKGSLGLKVVNQGMEECLKRQHVICIIKNRSFRPPPESTVLLMTAEGIVLGEEILPGDRKRFENVPGIVFLSEDFVVYTDRKGESKEYFLMPPVSFPEVAAIEDCRNVVSCSPSPPSDMKLREVHGVEDDPKLASIMIGFDCDTLEP